MNVGNTDSELHLDTSGKIKYKWGGGYRDLLKNGFVDISPALRSELEKLLSDSGFIDLLKRKLGI